MEDYELELEENNKRNKKFIKNFEKWLNAQNLGKKTIRKHVNNIDLFINDYVNYYEVTKMEDGIGKVHSFLNDWFIRKCAWASVTSIKETAASIKKFYQCMSEEGFVSSDDYKFLCRMIKDNMDNFIDSFMEYEQYYAYEEDEFI